MCTCRAWMAAPGSRWSCSTFKPSAVVSIQPPMYMHVLRVPPYGVTDSHNTTLARHRSLLVSLFSTCYLYGESFTWLADMIIPRARIALFPLFAIPTRLLAAIPSVDFPLWPPGFKLNLNYGIPCSRVARLTKPPPKGPKGARAQPISTVLSTRSTHHPFHPPKSVSASGLRCAFSPDGPHQSPSV